MKKVLVFIFIISSALTMAASGETRLETVDYVDVDRYLGKWYEIARFDQRFQKGCTATTAEYTKNRNGTLRVLNSCRIGNPDGPLKQAVGRARIVDRDSNAKLKVQFFLRWLPLNFLAGDYWIIGLGEDYEYAVVGAPNRDYLWILSRTPKMEETLYLELVQMAENKGFDVSKLLITEHK